MNRAAIYTVTKYVAIQALAVFGGYRLAVTFRFPARYPHAGDAVWLFAFVLLIMGLTWSWMNGPPDRRAANAMRCALILVYCAALLL